MAALSQRIEAEELEEVRITSIEELRAYATLGERLGRGESASIALASSRGWLLGTDDEGRRLRRAVHERLNGRTIATRDILCDWIRRGVISVREADQFKRILDQKNYRMPFGSFADSHACE